MTKKISCIFVMVLVFLCMLASCGECKHENIERTCTTVICKDCGGTTPFPPLEHTYGEWSVEQFNCITSGEKTRTCSTCGKKETEQITARGYHNFSIWTTAVEANCIQDGIEERVCSDCGETETNTLPQKTFHRYDNYACLDCGNSAPLYFSVSSTPMSVSNMGSSAGTTIIEKYQIYQIEVSVISWNLDGTCTVEISIDAEKTYESSKGYYMPDEIPITITDSNGETTYEAISFHTKSLTLEVDASLHYDIIVKEHNWYV